MWGMNTLSITLALALAVGEEPVRFSDQVRPILSRHCIACHGPDEGDRQADLRLDVAAGATADRGGYAALVPGDPDASELLARVRERDGDLRMPPPDHGKPLSADEIDVLRRWIAQGGDYQTHWAFVAPVKPAVPTTAHDGWARSEIDRFVAARWAEAGLTPAPEAEPHRLVRRLALDLTGLPPSPEQVARFAAEPTDAVYEGLVDELLASPGYGEHWAAMWLDLARYADTVGYAEDKNRTVWPWRDWLIRALDADVSYDRLTTLMLAGDLLPGATDDDRLATAFHRNTLNNTEGGTNDEEFRTIAVKDRIGTTVNVWMGVTMRCAECHSHKYDPVSQRDYYAFLDLFNQTADADTNDDAPTLPIAALAGDGEAPKVPVMAELPEHRRRTTHIMLRGNYKALGEPVTADVPASLAPWPEDAPRNRLGVAQWLTSDANPLTARVAVNRYWARLFGKGIVETEEDFGTQGTPPTHPLLLDWLAVTFREDGWDVKRLLRRSVTSATYRQSAAAPASVGRDPRNLLLARGPRRRLRAEVVRDATLAVAGLLSDRKFGPPVYPPNPVKEVRSAFAGVTKWTTSAGEDRHRRTLYTYLKRSAPHPLLETFDIATREVCSMRRLPTNTPLQSFLTLNDEGFLEAAVALAGRMAAADEPLRFGVEAALCRPATDAELAVLRRLRNEAADRYAQDPAAAAKLVGDAGPDRAALAVVANTILNLDEFLTK